MRKIDISTKKYPNCFALVDDENFDFLNRWKWYRNRRGYVLRTAHVGMRNGKRVRSVIRMHRLVNGIPPKGFETDHINRNRLDNRRKNLRFCTKSQNRMNARSNLNGTSRYKGVSLYGKTREGVKKWQARIYPHGKRVYLGTFLDEEEAARVYDEKARELFGEFARLNFPRQSH